MDVLPDQALDCPEELQHLLVPATPYRQGETFPKWALALGWHNQEADRLKSTHSVSFCGNVCLVAKLLPSRSCLIWSNF